MDHQFYRPMPDRHSKHMENLSLIMGIIALSTFCLVYPALICGAHAAVRQHFPGVQSLGLL